MRQAADILSRRRKRSWWHRRGGSSTEYILVLALVVLPIAALAPMLLGMIVAWSQRIWVIFRLPLG